MKIAILTLPFNNNYGGVLQAYALQVVLRRMGHLVWTEDRLEESTKLKRGWALRIKNFFYFLLKKRRWIFRDLTAYRSAVHPFIKSHIRLTQSTRSNTKEVFSQYEFEAYIVGSDQVWRSAYSPFLYNYFLDFTKEENVKRIAYAASFGLDKWEFTPEQTSYCAALLKKFDAISVRETTGIQLCEEYLGVKAIQVLDPTLLLTKDDYLSLTEKNSLRKCKKEIAAYILDMDEEKHQIMSDVSDELQCKGKIITLFPCQQVKKWKFYENKYYLSVENWLTQISKADFVITDSFHGCIFTILFNKPFVAIENDERGSTRFHSLLDLLDLQDRLVGSYSDFLREKTKLIHKPIDYGRVNSILNTQRNESIYFLTKALNDY